jgi:MFS family permease
VTATRGREALPSTGPSRTGVRALWGANGVSALGAQTTNIAIPWFILETTGSAAQTALVATAMTVGAVLASALSGPLIDRFGFRRASVVTDVVSGLGVAAIPVLYAAGLLRYWLILVLVFLITCMQAPGDSARYALVPGLSARAAMTVERANAVDRSIARGTMVVGPVVGGLLIAVFGPADVLYVQAAAFLVSALLVAALVHPRGHADGGAAAPGSIAGYRTELMVGLRFVAGSSLLVSVVLVASVANAIDGSLITVVLPVYVQEIWSSPTDLGFLVSAIGAGSLLGTAVFGAIGQRMPRRLTFLLGGAGGALLLYGGLALTPPLGAMVFLVLLAGAVGGPVLPLLFTVVQTTTPPEVYGRVFGALQSLSAAVAPFGIAAVGFAIEAAGVVSTVVVLGAVYLALTLGMLLNPALHRMDDVRTEVAR